LKRAVEFVGTGQKPAILIGVLAGKSVGRALTALDTSSLAILLYQTLGLDAGITADLLQKTGYFGIIS
jgi:hypothetical protein